MGQWLITQQSGGVQTAPSMPDAPNVTATCVPYYADVNGNEVANGEKYGFKGAITIPSGDTSHLRIIHVVVTDPAGGQHEVYTAYAPSSGWSTNNLNWKSDTYDRPEVSVTMASAAFLCENDNSHITASPYTVTAGLTVVGLPANIALQVTAVTATVVGTGVEAKTGDPKANVSVTFTPPTGWDAGYICVWLKEGSDAPFQQASFALSGVTGNTVGFWVDRPAANASTVAYVVALKNGTYYPLDLAASWATAAIKSAPFTLTAASAAAATDITDAALAATSYPPRDDGSFYFAQPYSFTCPTLSQDVEFWLARITVQKTDANGNAAPDDEGVEREMDNFASPGQSAGKTLLGNIPVAPYNYYRFKVYVVNHLNQATLQTNAWSGTAPTGITYNGSYATAQVTSQPWTVDPSRLLPSKYVPNVNIPPGTGANLITNPDFEYGWAHWTQVGSLNSAIDPNTYYTGGKALMLAASSGGFTGALTTDYYPCVPGDKFVWESWQVANGGTNGQLNLAVIWYDAHQAELNANNYYQLISGSATYPWTDVKLNLLPAPAGASYFRLQVYAWTCATGNYWVDNVSLVAMTDPAAIPLGPGVVTTQDGTQITLNLGGGMTLGGDGKVAVNPGAGLLVGSDGKVYTPLGGGLTYDATNNLIKLNPGAGIAIDGNGAAYVPIGAGLKTSGGQIVFNPGSGLSINGDGTAYIPQSGVTDLMLAGGNSVAVSYGLPGLPQAAYPVGKLLFNTADGKQYRNVNNVWTKGTDPADLVAGTIAAGVYYGGTVFVNQIGSGTLPVGVVYAGTILGTQIAGGTISASITMTSPSLVIKPNFHCTITINQTDSIKIIDTQISVVTQLQASGLWLTSYYDSTQYCTVGLGGMTVTSSGGYYPAMYNRTAISMQDPSATIYLGSQVTISAATASISIGGFQVLKTRQTGPGNPSFASLFDAQTWCGNLLLALRAHGLVN